MKNIFEGKWINLDQMVAIIANENAVKQFLKDIQTEYRIQRALWPDVNDQLLNGTYTIDNIISRLEQLEPARKEYFERLETENTQE